MHGLYFLQKCATPNLSQNLFLNFYAHLPTDSRFIYKPIKVYSGYYGMDISEILCIACWYYFISDFCRETETYFIAGKTEKDDLCLWEVTLLFLNESESEFWSQVTGFTQIQFPQDCVYDLEKSGFTKKFVNYISKFKLV